ncbi:hypothetical protein SNF32_07040 [Enterococcus mundtii]|nr:hypothetical protein [Enterococcus mundtii]MDY4307206.1 hypothetical protein [Enterococcus mundtii]
MKKYFRELSIALVKVLSEFWSFLKYLSRDFEKGNKTWKDFFKE